MDTFSIGPYNFYHITPAVPYPKHEDMPEDIWVATSVYSVVLFLSL